MIERPPIPICELYKHEKREKEEIHIRYKDPDHRWDRDGGNVPQVNKGEV